MEAKEVLRSVKDPELGVSIVDMGLVYGVEVDGKTAHVTMTLTTPMCPAAGFLVARVEGALRDAGYVPHVDVTFDPPWSPDMMSDELRKKFGF
jgi:metal-sulfur cluster biosynthetic enzyme